MTPYYEHAGITIYHGDCRLVLPTLPKCDLLLTDPPYGINYNPQRSRRSTQPGRNRKIWKSVEWTDGIIGDEATFDPSHLMDYRKAVIWGGNNFTLPVGGWFIWDKCKARNFVGSDAELAWTNLTRLVRKFTFMWDGFRRDGEQGEHYHPTQKPKELMTWCIEQAGNAEVIVDPYMGSGTTLVAAKNLGRKAIGIEIEERYCEIAAKRLSQEVFDFSQ
jgi:site-specific DNA-methyltransferase (adenine-specific)